MTALRKAAQQALEALQHLAGFDCDHLRSICVCEYRDAADALRAALAQEQAEPWTPAALGPSLKLWFDPANPWASVQAQVEPAQQVMQDAVTTGVGIIRGKERIDPASIHKQAEPAQEPVTWVASEDGYTIQDNCFTHDAVLRVSGDFETDEQRIRCAKRIVDVLNAAPPRRTMVPLTDEEIMGAFHAARNAKLGTSQDNSKHRLSVLEIARAIEKASWEKNYGQA